MRNYEGVFIFETSLEEEKRNGIFDKFKNIIEAKGEITNIDEWGVRKLAYEINDLTEGYYIVMTFNAETEVVKEMERVAKITEGIMRLMVVRDEQ
ncbi:30S ribosomal protein S6 [Senegalia massiliensis]|jgi:small subunit ribosomal protein S6|uniref:Small ribosomal subunit protein bS6 n=1 Tax=Senegalia massiliensis TaxID=1720316 RepID=A0A845R1V9_9CLOT|nr:30S ribosomal protein S6 [Senegalia massiliensis]NBI06563.1 30S ribosomal protein S6 [Senegalia massiliensis]